MKKIIICMLLLLPLIIVASVLLAIDIISVEAYIPVERVVLNHNYIEQNLSDKSFDGLVATVYPTSAHDKKITWTIQEEIKTVPDYLGKAAEVDNNGKVSFYTYATFKVVATAAGKSASCSFYIKGDKPESVVIDNEISSLYTGDRAMLSAVFHPIDAIVDNVIWTTSNNEILSVDNNGIVTAKRAGTATVTVEIKNTQIKTTKEITVIQGVTPYGTTFYASNGFSLSEIDNPLIVSGGTITDNKLYFDADQAILTSNGNHFSVIKCASDDIIIEHSEFFEGNYKLKVGKLPLTLNVIYKEANRKVKPAVQWTSSDTSIAEIDNNGLVNAKETGFVTFTAKDLQTNNEVSITIRVVKPVSLILLDTQDSKRGIAQKVIYGNTDYINGEYKKAYMDIEFTLPQKANKNEFIYQSDNPTLAYFENNRLYFTDKITGIQKISIKVSAKERPYESVEVFTRYDIYVGEGVNCYNYNDLNTVVNSGKRVFLQSNIEFNNSTQKIILKNDLYGNGYTLEGKSYSKKNENSSFFAIGASNITISNLRISADDPAKMSEPNGMHGTAISIGDINQPERFTNIRVEYSTLENCYYALEIYSSDVAIEGCIIRNTSNFGIFAPATKRKDGKSSYNNLVMTNNVMTNMVAPAIGVPTEHPQLEQECTLHVKGFLDVYNWQDLLANKMLDRDIIKGNQFFNTAFKSLLENLLANELAKDDYKSIRYTVQTDNTKTEYIHLGIIQAGGIVESKSEIIVEDKRFTKFELEALTSPAIKKIITLQPVYLYLYDVNQEITPESAFVESLELYKKLRGE